MKIFLSAPIILSALFVTALSIGGATPSYAEPSGIAVLSSPLQDTAQDSSAPEIAGTWQLSFTDMRGNARQATLDIQQNGSSLSGKFHGERGSGSLTGTLQGTQVSMTVSGHGREISFTGTVDGSKMSGTTAQGSSWSATRQ